MRISLAGPSYTSRSVEAAAQQTLNLVPEAIEVPNETSRLVLYGRPGLKYFATLNPPLRGLWAGGGRLFGIGATDEFEIHSDGTLHVWSTGIVQGTSGQPDPAQIFSNGHQLMIVAAGKVYVDNGTGAVPAQLAVTGNGNTVNSASSLQWVSGPTFSTAWSGAGIWIDNVSYVITGVPSSTTIYLDHAPPDASNVVWETAQGGAMDGVTGGYLDGYFVVNRVATPGVANDPGRQFNISALNDGTRWSPLDFGVKEGGPDYIRSILCDHEELWLFGRDTIEIWTNVGSQLVGGVASFPFQRIPGAFIHDGTAATYCPVSIGLSVCYLGGGNAGETVAYQAQGLQPARISTHAQEQIWNSTGYNVNDAFSYGYSENGHQYWVVGFYSMQQCWVYDLTEGLWHERSGWNAATQTFPRHLAFFHAYVPEWGTNGIHIVGDPVTGNLYQQSTNYYDDAGNPIEYLRSFPHLINENQYGYHHRFELLMEMGAQASGVAAPTIALDWSDDYGHTFDDSISRSTTGSASGNYQQRVAFRRLGAARDRVYRVGVTAQSKVALIDAYLEMTPGFA